jgi:hypothetical protein
MGPARVHLDFVCPKRAARCAWVNILIFGLAMEGLGIRSVQCHGEDSRGCNLVATCDKEQKTSVPQILNLQANKETL